ncbi:MAG: hypothetical protein AAGI30_09595 [Planctomycetota bacterium]
MLGASWRNGRGQIAGCLLRVACLLVLCLGGSAGGQGIEIGVERFGVGGVSRPGEWTGVRLTLLDQGDRPRNVAVRLLVEDSNGDSAAHQRRVTLTPGRPAGVWVYARLPWTVSRDSRFTVTVRELIEREGGEPIVGGRIATSRISPSTAATIVPASRPMIGVVGSVPMGLEQYELFAGASGTAFAQTMHEPTSVVAGLLPADLPDRWVGLMPFETLVWADVSPSRVRAGPRAEAIREWVALGGHLVIVLPVVGQEWFGTDHPLRDVLPRVEVVRGEAPTLEPYRGWLTSPEFSAVPMPERWPLYAFEPVDGASVSEAMPLIVGPEGAVAVRRVVGAGMVTVVGLDVSAPELWQSGLVRADFFWHRLLGQRGEAPTPAERDRRSIVVRAPSLREQAWSDDLIGPLVTKRAAASVGVLVALLVFATYWVVAGPGGFSVLRWRKKHQHSWVMFAGCAVVFSLVSWAGAYAIRPKNVEASHFTVLDHVYGEPVQRVRAWAGVLLPYYGTGRLTVGDEDQIAAISTWEPVAGGGGALIFPDRRAYAQDITALDTLALPARATVQSVRWDAVIQPRWATPIVFSGDRPRVESRVSTRPVMSGRLQHDLPATIEDGLWVLVRHQRDFGEQLTALGNRDRGPLLSDIWVAVEDAWPAGEARDLARIEGWSAFDEYVQRRPGNLATRLADASLGAAAFVTDEPAQAAQLFSLHGVLPVPPEQDRTRAARVFVSRRETHGLDLARWSTQPCLMFIGLVRGPTPAPLRSGDREIASDGVTIVRWIYPLDADPLTLPDESEAQRQRAVARQIDRTKGARD